MFWQLCKSLYKLQHQSLSFIHTEQTSQTDTHVHKLRREQHVCVCVEHVHVCINQCTAFTITHFSLEQIIRLHINPSINQTLHLYTKQITAKKKKKQ